MEPDFIDLPPDPRQKYPALLDAIREATTAENQDQWVILSEFLTPASARDSGSRLRGIYPLFEFASRSDTESDKGLLYVRYIGEL